MDRRDGDRGPRFGHKAGDDLLKSVARLLKQRARQADILARLGGDEFALFLPQTSADHAEIARGLQKQTVVKFVAEQETLGLLRKIGVDYAQGYYIEEPRPILAFLGSRDSPKE